MKIKTAGGLIGRLVLALHARPSFAGPGMAFYNQSLSR